MGMPNILITPSKTESRSDSKAERPTSAGSKTSNSLEPRGSRGHTRSSSADIRWSFVKQLNLDSHRSASLPSVSTPCCSKSDTCKETGDGITGKKLQAFYQVWSIKDTGKKAVQHRQLEPPAAWKRNENFRTCGCATRTHLNTLRPKSGESCSSCHKP
ncbi:hypothetical protein KP79_PYT14611 [Mizuhopecten yessoensis]|uniref:Uncharacterized protein n=1 Tax=Mizuhopecten yessoensis TaxID=6573 RepID=A0A210QJ81_MIZYE|nr:hypothetical protein KP79_PYT14611 [Mizuhopecten yessoensis]